MALRISRAASSRISMDACSLYQAACGVQIRLGASFRGPWLKLWTAQCRSECHGLGGARAPTLAWNHPHTPLVGPPRGQPVHRLLVAVGRGFGWGTSAGPPVGSQTPGPPGTTAASRKETLPGYLLPCTGFSTGASGCGHVGASNLAYQHGAWALRRSAAALSPSCPCQVQATRHWPPA